MVALHGDVVAALQSAVVAGFFLVLFLAVAEEALVFSLSLSPSLSSALCKQQRISVSLRTFYFFLLVSPEGSSNYPKFWNSGQG